MFSITARLVVGFALITFGAAEMLWGVRRAGRKSLAVQGLLFAELGLMAIALAVISQETAQLVVLGMLGLGAIASLWLQMTLVRRERGLNLDRGPS